MPYTPDTVSSGQTILASTINKLGTQYAQAVNDAVVAATPAALSAVSNLYTPLAQPSILTPYQKALGAIGDSGSTATILMTGDSWVEGSGTTVSLGQRIIDRIGQYSGTSYAPTAPVGNYLPAVWGGGSSTLSTQPAVLSGNYTIETANWGLGQRDIVLTAAGTVTWTVTGRYAKLFYLQYPGQGNFNIIVDGNQVANIATAGTENDGAFYQLDMATDSSHTVQASWVSGGVRVFGVQYYSSNTKINVIDGGHAGSYAHIFNTTNGAYHWNQAKVMNPDLSIICTGLNTFYQLGITNFASDFASVLSAAQAALPNASHLVVAQAFPQNGNSGAGGASWSQFVVIEEAAAASAGFAFLDLGAKLPAFSSDAYSEWQSDGIHPNKFGQGILARYINNYVSVK